jgi:hypothetical protein
LIIRQKVLAFSEMLTRAGANSGKDLLHFPLKITHPASSSTVSQTAVYTSGGPGRLALRSPVLPGRRFSGELAFGHGCTILAHPIRGVQDQQSGGWAHASY